MAVIQKSICCWGAEGGRCQFIGWLELIFSVLTAILLSIFMGEIDVVYSYMTKFVADYFWGSCRLYLALLALNFILAIVLLNGAYQNSQRALHQWVFLQLFIGAPVCAWVAFGIYLYPSGKTVALSFIVGIARSVIVGTVWSHLEMLKSTAAAGTTSNELPMQP